MRTCPISLSIEMIRNHIGIPKFQHLTTFNNFLLEAETKGSDKSASNPVKSDNLSDKVRHDPTVELFVLSFQWNKLLYIHVSTDRSIVNLLSVC